MMALHQFDRMVVEDEGEGPVVVCVHGRGGSSNSFSPLMLALSRCRVLRVDLPGSGRSQRAEGPLSIERFVHALLSMCNRLGVDQADWVGHSMGTIVCQHVATTQPALVRSLALFGPLMAPSDPARTGLRARAAKARSEGVAGMHEITQTLLAAALSSDTRQRLPLATAFVRESLMRQEGEAYARTCEALAEAQAARVETIRMPVLLVTGDEDTVAPPASVRAMGERLQDASVEVLRGCGHWTPIEKPAECAALLRAFLARRM